MSPIKDYQNLRWRCVREVVFSLARNRCDLTLPLDIFACQILMSVRAHSVLIYTPLLFDLFVYRVAPNGYKYRVKSRGYKIQEFFSLFANI